MKKSFLYIAVAAIMISTACKSGRTSTDDIAASVDSFAVNYFNWHFAQAAKFCTTDSFRWLQFAASQVDTVDIKALRNKKTQLTVEVNDIDINKEETEAQVSISVSNYMAMGKYGMEPKEISHDDFCLNVVRTVGGWKVRMEALPQSEKQNHG